MTQAPGFRPSRRSVLTGLGLLPLAGLVSPARAATRSLTATTRVLDIKGRAATVFGLVGPDGTPGLVLDEGERFAVSLTNGLDIPTLIHWHGQIPPNVQDGVPDMPAPMLKPGETRDYDFAATPGTHWMHAHIPAQEVGLLAAPLIVRQSDTAQEVTLFLHDFSFTPPEEVLARMTSGMAMAGHDMGAMKGHDMSKMKGMDMGAMGGAMDVNDFDFDAYLANDRTLDDPQVVTVDKGERVHLRIVNAASATVFWIDTGALPTALVAVDGAFVQPVIANRFALAMGQRMDLDLAVSEGAFPILALREGAVERTGIILATPGAKVEKVAGEGEKAPAWSDLSQEGALRAVFLQPARKAKPRMVMLGGQMMPYQWTIDGQTWGNHTPLTAKSGERVELMFHNMSMMSHPMHLHGHKFQVVDVGQGRFAGAVRDTVLVPPMGMVTVAFDAGEPGSWMLHCHHMAHLATGMMTEFIVS